MGQEGPLEEEMTTHSSILARRIPWTEEPGGLGNKEHDCSARAPPSTCASPTTQDRSLPAEGAPLKLKRTAPSGGLGTAFP